MNTHFPLFKAILQVILCQVFLTGPLFLSSPPPLTKMGSFNALFTFGAGKSRRVLNPANMEGCSRAGISLSSKNFYGKVVVGWCVVLMQNPPFVLPTYSVMIMPLILKKTISIAFSFNLLIYAFFILGGVGVFQRMDCLYVSLSY